MMDIKVTRHGPSALLYIGTIVSTVMSQYIGTYPKIEIGPYSPWPPPYSPYQDRHLPPPPPYPLYQERHLPPPPPYSPYQERHLPPPSAHAYLSHPGYQTDIIINPYNQNEGMVRITTKDVSTGLEIGNTEWSGPGTLTLSTLATSSSLHDASGKAGSDYEFVSVPIRASHDVPASARPEHPHGASARPEHPHGASARPEHPHGAQHRHTGREPLYPGQAVLGSPCSGLYDCSTILNGVCGYNSYCRGVGCSKYTCQCPKGHTPIYNSLAYTHPKTPTYYSPHDESLPYTQAKRPPKRRKRSLRYYQECQKHI